MKRRSFFSTLGAALLGTPVAAKTVAKGIQLGKPPMSLTAAGDPTLCPPMPKYLTKKAWDRVREHFSYPPENVYCFPPRPGRTIEFYRHDK